MKRLTKWIIVVLLFAQLFSLSAVAVLAAPGSHESYNPTLSEAEIQAQLGLPDGVDILTDDEMSRLIQVCHAIGAYLVRNSDGTLSLNLQNPAQVGVDHAFLRNYRTGLQEINALIRMGWLTVDNQFNLIPGPALPTSNSAIDAGLTRVEEQVAGKDVFNTFTQPEAAQPNSHYGRGFLFSFNSSRHYIPYRYASFGPTFASYFRRGRFGARFSLLFGLHRHFFNRSFRYGGYGYIPYQSFYHYGYNLFYYYPYSYGRYGRWYYTYLWY